MKNLVSLFWILVCALPLIAQQPLTLKTWTRDTPVETYQPGNLWELINGAADAFVSYGLVEMRAMECSQGDFRFSVHVYDMGTPLNAFGIYRTENPPLGDSKKLGAETQFSDYLAVMLTGRYYVKVESIKGKADEANTRSLLQELHENLEVKTEWPLELTRLPEKGRLEQSEFFVKTDFLGLSQLKDCLFARYREGELTYRLFIMPGHQPEPFLATLPDGWKKESFGEKAYLHHIDLPYIGPVGITRVGDELLGIVDIKEESVMKRVLLERLD
jgi:hypothetical protein